MIRGAVSIVLVCMVLVGARELAAQRTAREETPSTLKGFFMLGGQRLDLEELNGRMVASGFPSFSEDFLSLGAVGWWMKGRFLIGGEGHALLGSHETTPDGTFKTRIKGWYGQVDLGSRIYRGERLDVAPVVGLGGGSVSVELLGRASPNFDDILDDPLTGTRLTAEGFHIDLSMAADFRITGSEDAEGGFTIGLRGGYAHSLGSWDWNLKDEWGGAGGPELGPRGVYLRIMLGGWRSG